MSSLFHLVYVSKAVADISYTDIHNILEVSRLKNLQDGITGVLIFRDGYFLQLLEGPEEKVRQTLNRIILDDRNFDLHVLIETVSTDRLFSDWTMAFYDGDLSANATEDLLFLFEACLDKRRESKSLIMPMIRQFRATAPEFK